MAAVSWGAMTIPLTPWLMSVWVLEINVDTSFCELVVLMSTPSSCAEVGTNLM